MLLRTLFAVLAASLALPLGATSPMAADPGPEPYAITQTSMEGVTALGREATGTFGAGQSFVISATSRLHSISVYISNPRYVSNMELLGLRQGDETDRIVCELLDPSPLAQGLAPRVLARSEIAGFGAGADWRTFTFPEQPLLPPGTYLFGVSVTTGGLYGYHLTFREDAYSQGRAYMQYPPEHRWGTMVGDSAFGIGLTRGGELLRESTPPVVAATYSPPPNEHGWNNSPVAVAWTASDPESGIVLSQECQGRTLQNETEGIPLTCTAINGAGMRSSATVMVRIDGTPPTIDASVDPPEEPDGWRYAETTVTFSAADQLSGVATVSPPVVLAGQGEGLSATGTATDLAGNTASVTIAGINVWVEDRTVEPEVNSNEDDTVTIDLRQSFVTAAVHR